MAPRVGWRRKNAEADLGEVRISIFLTLLSQSQKEYDSINLTEVYCKKAFRIRRDV